MNGIRMSLADDLIGIVIEEMKPTKTTDVKQMELKSSFSEIHSWQLDEPELNHRTDTFCKAMNWIDISKIVSILAVIENFSNIVELKLFYLLFQIHSN